MWVGQMVEVSSSGSSDGAPTITCHNEHWELRGAYLNQRGAHLNVKLGDTCEGMCDIGEDGGGEGRVFVGQPRG